MFRPAGCYAYKTQDGGETVSATPSLGLFHWYSRIVPKLPLPDPMPILEVVQVGRPIPGPYHPMFLTLVISGIERTYGTAPEIASEISRRDWYNNLPEGTDDHKIVVQARRDGHPKVVCYEEVCLYILKWLVQYGDIIDLEEP